MLQAFGLSYAPDPRGAALFENVDLSVDYGEKVALVGRNGLGKSILLNLLAGRLAPQKGRVVRQGGAQIAYLAQDFDHGFEGTLTDLLAREAPDTPEYAVARILHRLRLDPCLLHQEYRTLSLGERMRGALAALLAAEPDMLLLDEPTNHLDLATREWLETFLAASPEAVLLVCHDRAVINAVADRVLELDRGGLTSYTGNYDDMVAAKEKLGARQREAYERHKEEDRRLRVSAEETLQRAMKVTRKPGGGNYDPKKKAFYAAKEARMDKRAKAVLSRVEKMRSDAPDKPFEADAISLEFPCRPLRSGTAVTVRKLFKSFRQELFKGLNVTLEPGGRTAVVGPNGAGKSTLFRILLEEIEADSGEIVWAPDAQVATLSQARNTLDPKLPAAQALKPKDKAQELFARSALGRLGMRGVVADRPVGVLSVGERTKVEIVSMLLTGANVLILDEPTNHLDIPSMEALEEALMEFPGAVLFASHDRAFVERVATDIVELRP